MNYDTKPNAVIKMDKFFDDQNCNRLEITRFAFVLIANQYRTLRQIGVPAWVARRSLMQAAWVVGLQGYTFHSYEHGLMKTKLVSTGI